MKCEIKRCVCRGKGGFGKWKLGTGSPEMCDVMCRTLVSGLGTPQSGLFVYIVPTELTQDFVGDVSITKGELSSLSSSMYI